MEGTANNKPLEVEAGLGLMLLFHCCRFVSDASRSFLCLKTTTECISGVSHSHRRFIFFRFKQLIIVMNTLFRSLLQSLRGCYTTSCFPLQQFAIPYSTYFNLVSHDYVHTPVQWKLELHTLRNICHFCKMNIFSRITKH